MKIELSKNEIGHILDCMLCYEGRWSEIDDHLYARLEEKLQERQEENETQPS